MFEEIAETIDRREYNQAIELIKKLSEQDPNNPQLLLYTAAICEKTNKIENAQKIYRQLLQTAINPKILAEARQGIGRVEASRKQAKTAAIAELTNANSTEMGLLILEPLTLEQKSIVAPKFAQIMNLDNYSAKLQLPSRGWRLYRYGKLSELQYYSKELNQAEVPCFAVSFNQIQDIPVYQVDHFISWDSRQATIITHAEQKVTFNWSGVKQLVHGSLPIFEEVFERDFRNNKTQWKSGTSDYVQICDLHLPEQKIILRLCNENYRFTHHLETNQTNQDQTNQAATRLTGTTSRKNWQELLQQIDNFLPNIHQWNDFKPFAETALNYTELLQKINPQLHLLRRKDSLWDQAFEVYSGVIFCK